MRCWRDRRFLVGFPYNVTRTEKLPGLLLLDDLNAALLHPPLSNGSMPFRRALVVHPEPDRLKLVI
jgi:hypothetical protein